MDAAQRFDGVRPAAVRVPVEVIEAITTLPDDSL